MCNEFGCQQHDENTTLAIGVRFREIIKRFDPSRPISGAWSGGSSQSALAYAWSQQVVDMMGINYAPGSYDPFHQAFPKTPLISSESCSCTSDRTYEVNDAEALIGSYHAWSCIKDCWQPVAERESISQSPDRPRLPDEQEITSLHVAAGR